MPLDHKSMRYEIKFKVSYKDLSTLYSFLHSTKGFRTAYENRSVNSLYYDTLNYQSAFSNMSGESSRCKVRFRWYATEGGDLYHNFNFPNSVYRLEVKRKLNEISDKVLLCEENLSPSLNFERRLDILSQVVNSYTYAGTISPTPLVPAVFISYDRQYFELFSNSDIRITIDSNIRCSPPLNCRAHTLISHDFVVCELKFPHNLKDFVLSFTESLPFRRVRFSKYLAAICKLKNVPY